MRQQTIRQGTQRESDADLARRVVAGDRDAFALLMRRYNRPLYRAARSILRDDAEAEDALQEAYLLAFRHLGAFRGDSSLSTWLTRIVVNEAIARSRKTGRRAKVIRLGGDTPWDDAAETSMNQPPAEQPEHPERPEQPEQAAQRAEVRRLIEKRIDDLPEAFRTVFVLRAVEDLSVEETAAALGIPEATVRTRYFRARSLLRESLSRELDVALEGAFSFDGARCDRIVAGVLTRLADRPDGTPPVSLPPA
ncbi:MAG: RNA polymerase sigma factor [Burkholderiaceae bacterium]